MNKNLKKELKSTFQAPRPTRKQAFLNHFDYPKANRFDFIKSQTGYIRKRVWVLSILLFVGTLLTLYFYQTPISSLWVVSSVLPFLLLVSMTEITRSTSYNMTELEMSCKHSFSEVILARLGILGIFNSVVLFAIVLLFISKTDLQFFRVGLYLIMPFLLNCYGSLFVVNHLPYKEAIYICGGITGFVSILNSLITTQVNNIFAEKYSMFWIMVFIVVTVLIITEIRKFMKRTEELQWNSSLTA